MPQERDSVNTQLKGNANHSHLPDELQQQVGESGTCIAVVSKAENVTDYTAIVLYSFSVCVCVHVRMRTYMLQHACGRQLRGAGSPRPPCCPDLTIVPLLSELSH